MSEELDNPAPFERQPQPKEMKHYLELLADHGVDFDPSDLPHLAEMDDDELTEYFFQALLEAGVEDPEEFMLEHALVDGFRVYSEKEINARKSRELRGVGYKVDELNEQRRREARGEGDS